MSRVSVVIVFVALLLIELFGFVLPRLGGSHRPDVSERIYLIQQDGALSVLDEDTANALYQGPGPYPEYWAYLSGWRWPGPLPVLFEFYEQRRFDTPMIFDATSSEEIAQSDAEQQAIEDAALRYAKNDPVLRTYNPGGDPVTRFAPWRAVQTIIVWLLLCILPAMLAMLMYWIPRFIADARRADRARRGLCINCAYDCEGLDEAICPECGESHSLPNPA